MWFAACRFSPRPRQTDSLRHAACLEGTVVKGSCSCHVRRAFLQDLSIPDVIGDLLHVLCASAFLQCASLYSVVSAQIDAQRNRRDYTFGLLRARFAMGSCYRRGVTRHVPPRGVLVAHRLVACLHVFGSKFAGKGVCNIFKNMVRPVLVSIRYRAICLRLILL